MNNFKLEKSRGAGDLYPSFMLSAFNKASDWMESYMEFTEPVRNSLVLKQLEEAGFSQVFVEMFPSNDKDEAVTAAVARILTQQEDHGAFPLVRGENATLMDKARGKMALDKCALSNREFDEKTRAVMSMQTEKLDEIGERAVKIEEGVCGVIPDYQKEIVSLTNKLAHKTKECDRIEGQKGALTRRINELEQELDDMKVQYKKMILQLKQAQSVETSVHKLHTLYDNLVEIIEERQVCKRRAVE